MIDFCAVFIKFAASFIRQKKSSGHTCLNSMFVMGSKSMEDDLQPNKFNGFDEVTPRNKKNNEEEKLHSKKKIRYGHHVMVLLIIFGLKTHYKYFWWTRGNP